MTSGIEMDKYSDPVEVYSKMFKGCWNEGKNPYKDSTCPVNPFTLGNLFSSKMGKRDISVMIRNIFACSAYYKRGVYAYDIPPIMHLSSTPLIESIVAATLWAGISKRIAAKGVARMRGRIDRAAKLMALAMQTLRRL